MYQLKKRISKQNIFKQRITKNVYKKHGILRHILSFFIQQIISKLLEI